MGKTMTNENTDWTHVDAVARTNANIWDTGRLDAEHQQLLTELSGMMNADIVDVLDIIIGRYLRDAKPFIIEHRSAIDTMRTAFVNSATIADIMITVNETK